MAIPYVSSYDTTIPFSDVCEQFTLATNTVLTYTIPGTSLQKFQVLFGYNATSNVFVGKNATPAVPSSGSQSSTPYVEMRPKKRYVVGGDVLSFITPDAVAYVGVSIRQLQS